MLGGANGGGGVEEEDEREEGLSFSPSVKQFSAPRQVCEIIWRGEGDGSGVGYQIVILSTIFILGEGGEQFSASRQL